jgi:threonine synthase
VIAGYRCAVCGAEVGIEAVWPWRCPNATPDDRFHVLRIVGDVAPPHPDSNPFVAYRSRMAWHAFALAHGVPDDETVTIVRELDDMIAAVDGRGFAFTPFGRCDELSDKLGFTANGGIWVKDETGNVAGSHKGRHLMGVLLHLVTVERLGLRRAGDRPSLAIASCGNSALAAATLAAATRWPIDVYVPPHADRSILLRLDALAARVVTCPRRPGDPPGDPCMHRFREAVDGGAVPFTVQGPEDALCIDGGRTIGWEMARQLEGRDLDRVFVQVGGGALATAVGDAMSDEGMTARLHAVQTAGCAPLAAAWQRVLALGLDHARQCWRDCMRPWPVMPASAATGILDDETYDWLGVVDAVQRTGGSPVVAGEDDVLGAHHVAARTTGIPVDHTGTAGLAGLCAIRRHVGDSERVAVLFTGRRRPASSAGPPL